jgi:aspartyl-tRNA(Asn)/glutamyl-tRNA(Gln) amidotransferase subunit C
MARARDALRGTDPDHLIDLAGEELSDTGLTGSGLSPIKADAEVQETLQAFLASGSLDVARLRRALLRHLGDLAAGDDPEVLASRFVDAVRNRAWQVPREDRAAVVLELRQIVGSAPTGRRAVWPPTWIPRSVRAAAEEFAEKHVDEVRSVEQAFEDRDVRVELVRVLSVQPRWLVEGSAGLWAFMAHLASAFGLWIEASAYFLEAAERPGVDVAAMLSRAAEAAVAAGDRATADSIFERTRTVAPQHPEVILAEAMRISDPADQIACLDRAIPQSAAQVAAIQSARAYALLSLQRFSEARDAAAQALAVRPDSPSARELRPLLVLMEAASRASVGRRTYSALRDAGTEFLLLRDELIELSRMPEALRMQARAAEANALAGEFGVAEELLREAVALLPQADDAARAHLARVAVGLDLSDLALDFSREAHEGTPEVLLAVGTARIMKPTAEDRHAGAAILEELIAGPSEVREQAAFARLAGSAQASDVPWSELAERILADVNPEAVSILKAQRLIAEGESQAAEKLLLAQVAGADVLELLAVTAANQGEFARALAFANRAVDEAATPQRDLLRIEFARKLDQLDDYVGALSALLTDSQTPVPVRLRAYALAAERAWRYGQWLELVRLTDEWLQLDPRSRVASWAKVHALAQLGRRTEAVMTVDQLALRPRDEKDARLAASLFDRVLEPVEAVRRVADLLSEYPSDEQIQALLIHAGLRADREQLPNQLADLVQKILSEFPDRFPGSRLIRAIPAPETEAEVEEFFRVHFADNARRVHDAQVAVLSEAAPLALAAAVSGKQVALTWARAGFLPIRTADPLQRRAEVDHARDALGKGAVWDSSSLFIIGAAAANAAVAETVLAALPLSVLPQSVLVDADLAADAGVAEAQEEQLEAGWDPVADAPRIIKIPPAAVVEIRRRVKDTLRLARRLRVIPDVDRTRPTQFDHLVGTDDPPAFRTWPATFAAAEGWRLPIYSDDRFVRREAAGAGIPAFGTEALLEAMAADQWLAAEDAAVARKNIEAVGPILEGNVTEARWQVVSVAASPDVSFMASDQWRDVLSVAYAGADAAQSAVEVAFVLEVRRERNSPDLDRVRAIDELLASVDVSLRSALLARLTTIDPFIADVYGKAPRVALTEQDVRHVARLARLALTDEEVVRFGRELTAILSAVRKVSELDLDDVEPTSHLLALLNVWAEDEPRPCLSLEDALANAPERAGDFFRVPGS